MYFFTSDILTANSDFIDFIQSPLYNLITFQIMASLEPLQTLRRELRLRIDKAGIIPKIGELHMLLNLRRCLFHMVRMGFSRANIFTERTDNLRRIIKEMMSEDMQQPVGIGVKSDGVEISLDLALGGKSVLAVSIVDTEVKDVFPQIESLFHDRLVLH